MDINGDYMKTIQSNLSKCYAILYVPHFRRKEIYYVKEYLDLNFTSDINNVENICHYIEDVFGIKKYDIYWTFLDFDHFQELH